MNSANRSCTCLFILCVFAFLSLYTVAAFGFPDRWKIKDEFYNFTEFKLPVNVLVKLDEKTYADGKMGDNHLMAWYHEFEKGEIFFTAFGHTDEMFSNPVFLKHLLGGIQYVKTAPK